MLVFKHECVWGESGCSGNILRYIGINSGIGSGTIAPVQEIIIGIVSCADCRSGAAFVLWGIIKKVNKKISRSSLPDFFKKRSWENMKHDLINICVMIAI